MLLSVRGGRRCSICSSACMRPERLVNPEGFADFVRLPRRDADAGVRPSCRAPGRPRSCSRCSACATAARSSTMRCSPPRRRSRVMASEAVVDAPVPARLDEGAGGPPGALHAARRCGSARSPRYARLPAADAHHRRQGGEDVLPRHQPVVAAHPARRAGRRVRLQLQRPAAARQPAGDLLLQERHRLSQPRPGRVRHRLGGGALRLSVVQHGGPRVLAAEGRAAARCGASGGRSSGSASCRCWCSASCWCWRRTPICR